MPEIECSGHRSGIFRSSRRASRRSGLPPRKRRSTDTVIVRMPPAPERSGPQRSGVRPTAPPYHKTPVTPTTARTDRACTAFSLPRWRPTRHLRKEPGATSHKSNPTIRRRTPRRATTDRPPRRKSALRVRAFPYGGNTAGSGRRCRSSRTLAAATGRRSVRRGNAQLSPANFEADSPGPSNIVTRGSSAARRASSSQKSRTPTCTSDARDGASHSALNMIEACERTKPS